MNGGGIVGGDGGDGGARGGATVANVLNATKLKPISLYVWMLLP